MNSLSMKTFTRWTRILAMLALLAAPMARAEDIDIFAPTKADAASMPNILIMVDNSANWSRSAQKWPDNDGKQGAAELKAIRNVLNSSSVTINANVGFGGFTGSGSSTGGYIRFGMRDMTASANKEALTKILDHIASDINSSVEKVNDNAESAGLYEAYKYFHSLSVFRGGYVSGNNPASNVDQAGNLGNPSSAKPTAAGQGLTSGFAIDTANSSMYKGPDLANCGRKYVILMINNAQGTPPAGSQTFEGVSAGNSLSTTTASSWTDEWAKFLYESGVSVYVLDAYNAQHNESHSQVLANAARVAGGQYFPVNDQEDIELALKYILAEISSVNSTFASASLPISAANRSQHLNQVFIGMFRPDGDAKPRWTGNLKRYQLIETTGGVDLGDVLGSSAINLQTGFIADCAVSWWTTDSGSYWETTYANGLAKSSCATFPTVDGTTGSKWSDLPDGPAVEKGGVAEVLRKGNNSTSTTSSPAIGRNIYTYSSATTNKLEAISTTNTGWSTTLLNWVTGWNDETATTIDGVTTYPYSEFTQASSTARARPSIHGDVIHSRPLPLNYGTAGVTVFYGSNDGMLRAVNANDGKERWAFLAPEHTSRFQRLHDNSPLIDFYGNVVDPTLNPEPKDWFFDGSIGVYQNADSSKVWIFPSMRRGGRMLYGIDVSNPDAPSVKWRAGCTTTSDDTGCISGFENMGQTWGLPTVAFLKGHSSTTPVIMVGGGYDTCEDANSSAPSCTSRKGNGIFVLDADTGVRIAYLELTNGGSVASDIALADVNNDGSVDYAYAATTTGEIWRIDFSNINSGFNPLASDKWVARKVAYTSGGGRKFLHAPAVLYTPEKMYVAIGSGDREHPRYNQYPYDSQIQNRLYVLLDDLTALSSSTTATPVNLDDTTGMKDYSIASGSTCDVVGVTPTSGLKGWFMNFPNRGEQAVTSPLIAAGMVTINTNRALDTSQACASPLGEARGYWVNLLNASGAIGVGSNSCGGSRSSVFVGGGLAPTPTMATVSINGTVKTVAIGAVQRGGGASSIASPQEVKPPIRSKRRTVYWKSNTAD